MLYFQQHLNWKINFFGHLDHGSLVKTDTVQETGFINIRSSFKEMEDEDNDPKWWLEFTWDYKGNSNFPKPIWDVYSSQAYTNSSRPSIYAKDKTGRSDLLCMFLGKEPHIDSNSDGGFKPLEQYGYRVEVSIGSSPGRDNLYKWSLLPDWHESEILTLQYEDLDINHHMECRSSVIRLSQHHLKKANFVPKSGERYFINFRQINTYTSLNSDSEKRTRPLTIEWTAPANL